jgi:ACR3 family arsenite transporter
MGNFERLLSVWVGLAIVVGVVLGSFLPDVFAQVAGWEWAGVNVPVAILIWLMIYPMMAQVDFASIRQVGANPKGLVLTLLINWAIKPFTMAALGVLFFKYIFAPWVDPVTAEEYIAGMILLGVAPCTAMVFIWSQLTRGNANYTLIQVSVNDLIMVVAFAPIAGLLLGVTDIVVPWKTLLASVVLYVLLPLIAGIVTRYIIFRGNTAGLESFLARSKPLSILGLVGTVVLLFGFQAPRILDQPMAIVMIAIPLLIQTYGIFALAYWWAKRWRMSHDIAAPACMIATSNFFELAVAVAISLFGLHSGAALATVVGVLVEVPVMLSLVAFANKTKHWFA